MRSQPNLGFVLLLSFNMLASTVQASYGHGGHYKGKKQVLLAMELCLDLLIWIYSLTCLFLLKLTFKMVHLHQGPTDSVGTQVLVITEVMVVMAVLTTVESMALVDMLAWDTMAVMEVVTIMEVVTMGAMAMGVHQGPTMITKVI